MAYKKAILLAITFSFMLTTSFNSYAATPFFANGGLTENGIEWCEENYQLYEFMGTEFFEHHKHSIESRICVSLYHDPLWTHVGPDRYDKLVEQSREYAKLEIKESYEESNTGIIDTKPATMEEIPQEIELQEKEKNEQIESVVSTELDFDTSTKVEPDTEEIDTQENLTGESGGGCLIATATYGTELAPQVQQLREIRDNKLLQTETGQSFMKSFNQFYYSFSPYIADYERENPLFKEVIKAGITPMVSSLSLLNHVDMNSESKVLGYGISLIVLNLAMYIGIPFVAIIGIRKRF